MITSIAWLNQYLDKPIDADEAERVLTDLGFPIDGREQTDGDIALDVEITSNRGDLLSHVGQARELAAATGRTLKLPDCNLPLGTDAKVESLTSVENDVTDLCPVYTARVVCGVKVGPSPKWLVDRLASVGLRSVNNVVDITNFVLMELGQPLHAFDMARLDGRRIVVRRAAQGEAFTAIDGTKHTLRGDMLVIADASKPVAIAGVMGGLDSEVGGSSTDILLESAQFDPLSVRTTSRALKLSSDSSYRFERKVDPAGVETASRRAARLIVELAGGKLADGVIRVGVQPQPQRKVTIRVARCNALLGIDVPVSEMMDYFTRLGLRPQRVPSETAGGAIDCTIPTFRRDLEREVDLIEEVARMHGIDKLPVSEKIHIVARNLQPAVAARRLLRQVLVSHGYHEAMTFSFVTPKQAKSFLPPDCDVLEVAHGIRKNEPALRPSVLPSLLGSRKLNQDVGNHGVRLFETASTWSRSGEDVIERNTLAMIADVERGDGAGEVSGALPGAGALRDLRGTIEELIAALGGRVPVSFEPATVANMTAAACVKLEGATVIGVMGLLDDKTRDGFDLQGNVVAAELDVEALIDCYPPAKHVGDLPRFPVIERDLSVVVDEATPWATIESHVRATEPAMLEELRFLTTYRGKPIPPGSKSVSFRMLFRDPARTLRHEEVDPQVAQIVSRLKDELAAELRG